MGKNKKDLISIVVPCYNEAETITVFYETMVATFQNLAHCDFEIVFVDDGSKDSTLSKILALPGLLDHCIVLEFSRNFGKEAALTAGIYAANGDAVIPMDADLQDPPELIGKMIEKWKEGAEVVLARRNDRKTDSFSKRATASLFYRLHNYIASTEIPDNVGDFRLMDRVVVESLKKLPEHHRFMKGLFAWVGFKTVTIDYKRDERSAGRTKFTVWKLWNFAIEGITSFSTLPLKIWTYIGLIGALVSFIYGGLVIVQKLFFGIETAGYASLMIAILFFGSVQLISLGVIGEYVGRIYMETKSRPLFITRNTYGVKGGA